jgi:hypothetical protein
MPEFFHHDPLTGATEYFDYEEDTGLAHIHTVQDVSPLIHRNQAMANQGLADKGIKEGWWHYCDIPAVVEMELRKKGINIYDPNDGRKLFREINANYPYLKRTHKTHVGT